MTVKNIIDALSGIHFDMVLDAAPAEEGGASRTKPRKKKTKWARFLPIAACVLLCACLTPFVLNLLGGLPAAASEVRLTGISGGNLSELPEGVSELKLQSAPEVMLLTGRPVVPELTDEDFQQPEDVDVTGASSLSAVPQTVVLFDENRYASVTIALDNPYEYYICDFYMTCSQPDAMINVDNKWLPLDGSVKIRWTGSTNREATYTVYLPTVSGDTTVSITDMRYLNETEIAVDLAEHNVASVYRMETPLKTEFVVNTTEGFYFRVLTTENCLSYTVENAVPTEEAGVYRLEANGTYRVKYTYSIPGTDLSGEGEIVSEEIELLRISIDGQLVLDEFRNNPFICYVNIGDPYDEMWRNYGATSRIDRLELSGTGITFRKADPDDPRESKVQTYYFCDANLTISINGSEFAHCIYTANAPTYEYDLVGFIFNLHSSQPVDTSGLDYPPRVTIELKWNGYTIYKGDGSDLPVVG